MVKTWVEKGEGSSRVTRVGHLKKRRKMTLFDGKTQWLAPAHIHRFYQKLWLLWFNVR